MNKFFSSLVISPRTFPHVYQVFKPRYNKEFFKRLTKNIDQLEAHVNARCPSTLELSRDKLDLIKNESQRYVRLKDQLEKFDRDVNEAQYEKVLEELESIQERIMPSVIKIPNRFSPRLPDTDYVLEQVKSDFLKSQNLFKVLSHTKLSYINKCYSKSVVGPNSHYYTGIGAKLQLGLNNYFFDQLDKNDFIPVAGNCLAKSALIEACNSAEEKNYMTDPCRILNDDPKPTSFHMIEASRESLVGFLTSLGHIVSEEPVRFMCSGANYKTGSSWFDSDSRKVTQFQTLHALVWNSSIEQYSVKEYERVKNIIWGIYKQIDLPFRFVHCGLNSMYTNEYDAHRIEVWLPSQQTWIQTARISHFLDYISVRSGIKRGHLVDSMIYDGQALGAAIIENRQTANGRFIIPSALDQHMPFLTQDERSNYIEVPGQLKSPSYDISTGVHNMTNIEQRRYLHKKTALFSHSVRSKKNSFRTKVKYVGIFGMLHVIAFLDWEEIYFRIMPTWFQRLTYDYLYRPVRRIFWKLTYVGVKSPPDLTFVELDKSEYKKHMYQRRKDAQAVKGRVIEP